MQRRDLVDYGILSGVWGVSFAVLLKVVQAFGWVGAVTFRALIAGSLLFAIGAARKRRLSCNRPMSGSRKPIRTRTRERIGSYCRCAKTSWAKSGRRC